MSWWCVTCNLNRMILKPQYWLDSSLNFKHERSKEKQGWFKFKTTVFVTLKQWPLAGKFVEFEYSPKWPFWKIGRTRYIHPTLANHFLRTRYIRPTFANHFARTCQTHERQVWQLLHKFSEFGEFSECRLDRFIHIKYVICA